MAHCLTVAAAASCSDCSDLVCLWLHSSIRRTLYIHICNVNALHVECRRRLMPSWQLADVYQRRSAMYKWNIRMIEITLTKCPGPLLQANRCLGAVIAGCVVTFQHCFYDETIDTKTSVFIWKSTQTHLQQRRISRREPTNLPLKKRRRQGEAGDGIHIVSPSRARNS